MKSGALVGFFAALALLTFGRIATAHEAELKAYRQALESICQTGVTSEHVRLYEALVKAIEEAQYGRGRDSNFWGPRTPEHAYTDCFRGPSVFHHSPLGGRLKR